MNNPNISREDLPRFRFSRHAREVMARRQVAEVEVARALVRGSSHTHDGLQRYVHAGLCVVVDLSAEVIVTILLARSDQWTDEDARNR
ncbi:hypothetical protein J2Y69_003391 [Microbacterium resistens]|uniref:DUF4258 domain-containing protein n=1 Tax=Microbacterium resistens TaxID=156977 RepID=A0ABU1SGM6_9MICO|nr:hypothetical protein [Microbacterium resistens]MDR6868767.1 hypothetical protein [Microbacterium resistens]